jgi:hypothetical protein
MSIYHTRNGSTVKNLTVKRASETREYSNMRLVSMFSDGDLIALDGQSVLEGEVDLNPEADVQRFGPVCYATWYLDGRIRPGGEDPMDIIDLDWALTSTPDAK